MAAASPPPQRARRSSLAGLLVGGGGRSARAVAQATGLDDALERAGEEALVRAVESRAVERALARVLERATDEDLVERALASPALERALIQALDSELVDRLWERLLASDEAQKLVERIAEAPEVRGAIAMQGVGVVEDLGRQVGRVAGRLDDGAERVARLVVRRPRRALPGGRAGLVTRSFAFAFDAGLINLAFAATAALVAFVFGTGGGASGEAIAFGAGAWVLAISAYLVFFWTLAGQTPGMRLIGIRVESSAGASRLGFGQALRRLAGGALSAAALGLGFLAILISDRRLGWHDVLATTCVVRDEGPRTAPWAGPAGNRPRGPSDRARGG